MSFVLKKKFFKQNKVFIDRINDLHTTLKKGRKIK